MLAEAATTPYARSDLATEGVFENSVVTVPLFSQKVSRTQALHEDGCEITEKGGCVAANRSETPLPWADRPAGAGPTFITRESRAEERASLTTVMPAASRSA